MQRNRICACMRHKVESYANMLKAYPERSRSFNALLNRVLRAPTDRFTCATSSPRSAFPLVPLVSFYPSSPLCFSGLLSFPLERYDLRPVREISLLQRGSLAMEANFEEYAR